jgi:acetyl esterase/lipase
LPAALGVLALLAAACAVPSASGQGPMSPPRPTTRDTLGVSYGPLPTQLLDIHRPASGAGPFPVVLFFHGGGWSEGDRTGIPAVIWSLVPDTGVALVSVEYRLVTTNPDGSHSNTFPTSSYDVDRALRFVRANAARWDLDPNMIVVAGSSSGAHLAALAGTAPGVFRDPTLPSELASISPVVQGVLDLVGPSDLATFAQAGLYPNAITTAYLDCTPAVVSACDPDRLREASIAPHLTSAAPPAYLLYGVLDPTSVPATQGAPLALQWAAVRGDLAVQPVFARGVWYEEEANSAHDVYPSNSNFRTMETWLKFVIAGVLH